jgi:hemolysin III
MSRLREPFNAISHFIGAILAFVVLILLIIRGVYLQNSLYIIGSLIFGLAMIALYTMSGLYHGLRVSENALKIMRRLDHTMIYILIAGTYTPVCLIALSGMWRVGFLVAIWSIAAFGIATKWLWFNMPRLLYTSIYVVMGWIALVGIWPLYQSLNGFAFTMLVTGGVLYTMGAVVYAFKPKFFNTLRIGFHECFHLFILAGSAAHVAMVLTLS